MEQIKRVVHIGAFGRIGRPILQALLAAGFDVTVVTRVESQAVFPQHIKRLRIDCRSLQALTDAFTDQDAVVSTVGVQAIREQYTFIDAAVAAGVKRFIPSEFGCDTQNERTAASPAYKDRVDVSRYLERLTQDPEVRLTYTTIATSILIEALLHGPLPAIDYRRRSATLFDGGDTLISMTPASMVGKTVCAVLEHPELTANQACLVHGGAFTLRQVLVVVQKYVGEDRWTIMQANTAQMEIGSYEALARAPEAVLTWLPGFVRRCLFGVGFGGDFSGRTASDSLGLKMLSEDDLDGYIRDIIVGVDR